MHTRSEATIDGQLLFIERFPAPVESWFWAFDSATGYAKSGHVKTRAIAMRRAEAAARRLARGGR